MSEPTRSELYDGEVILTMDRRHVYRARIGDAKTVHVPNVTTILNQKDKSRALLPWAAGLAADHIREILKPGISTQLNEIEIDMAVETARNAHNVKRDAAASVGSIVHDYARRRLTGEDVDWPSHPQALNGADAFEAWLGQHEVQPIKVERQVLSKKHLYCGTADLLARIDNKVTLGDFKTSKDIYDEVFIQTAPYQKAMEEELGVKIEQRAVMHFDKENGDFRYALIPNDTLEDDFECFLALKKVYTWNKTAWPRVKAARGEE